MTRNLPNKVIVRRFAQRDCSTLRELQKSCRVNVGLTQREICTWKDLIYYARDFGLDPEAA